MRQHQSKGRALCPLACYKHSTHARNLGGGDLGSMTDRVSLSIPTPHWRTCVPIYIYIYMISCKWWFLMLFLKTLLEIAAQTYTLYTRSKQALASCREIFFFLFFFSISGCWACGRIEFCTLFFLSSMDGWRDACNVQVAFRCQSHTAILDLAIESPAQDNKPPAAFLYPSEGTSRIFNSSGSSWGCKYCCYATRFTNAIINSWHVGGEYF